MATKSFMANLAFKLIFIIANAQMSYFMSLKVIFLPKILWAIFTGQFFCMKFFMVVVIFLVFDIEVALILPMLFSGILVFSFITILTLGALYEWVYGGLN